MFATALEAERAFYDAFSSGDVEAMMRVWASDCDIVCVHPSGPRLEGRDEIRRSWEFILAERMARSFDLRGRNILGSADVRVHTLEENIAVPGTSFVAPPVIATNIYRRLRDEWHMIVHHASVAPAGAARATGGGEKPVRLH